MSDLAALTDEVSQFLLRSARLLDDEQFDEWLSVFDDDATYYVNSRDNVRRIAPGETFDDVVAIITGPPGVMALRVELVKDLWHAADSRAHTLHVISNIEVEPSGDAEVTVRSALLLYVTRSMQSPQLLAGRCEEVLRRHDGGWKVRSRRVLLEDDTVIGPLLVIV